MTFRARNATPSAARVPGVAAGAPGIFFSHNVGPADRMVPQERGGLIEAGPCGEGRGGLFTQNIRAGWLHLDPVKDLLQTEQYPLPSAGRPDLLP